MPERPRGPASEGGRGGRPVGGEPQRVAPEGRAASHRRGPEVGVAVDDWRASGETTNGLEERLRPGDEVTRSKATGLLEIQDWRHRPDAGDIAQRRREVSRLRHGGRDGQCRPDVGVGADDERRRSRPPRVPDEVRIGVRRALGCLDDRKGIARGLDLHPVDRGTAGVLPTGHVWSGGRRQGRCRGGRREQRRRHDGRNSQRNREPEPQTHVSSTSSAGPPQATRGWQECRHDPPQPEEVPPTGLAASPGAILATGTFASVSSGPPAARSA